MVREHMSSAATGILEQLRKIQDEADRKKQKHLGDLKAEITARRHELQELERI